MNFLISKLPAPAERDLSKGILDAIDMDSYRVEKRALQKILLPDEDAEIEPVPISGGGHLREPELDRLSTILRTFNDLFGDIAWEDGDRVRDLITKTIPSRVAADTAFRNAQRNSDEANARIEHDKALVRVMTNLMKDDTELFKQFMDNESFKRVDDRYGVRARDGACPDAVDGRVFRSCTASRTASRTCSQGVVSAPICVHLHAKISRNAVFAAVLAH